MPIYAILALLAAAGISAYAILTKVILRYRLCSAAYVALPQAPRQPSRALSG